MKNPSTNRSEEFAADCEGYSQGAPHSQITKEQIAHWRIWIAQRGADGDALCDLALKGLSGGPDEGYRVVKDGNAWCATGPGFINLQESKAGFGHTPLVALGELIFEEGET